MKKMIIAIALSLPILNINAQSLERNAFYGSTEFVFGTYSGINLNLNYTLNKYYSIQIGYLRASRLAKSQPKEYSDNTYDKLQNLNLLFGLGNNKIRIYFGIGYSTTTKPVNWQSRLKQGTFLWFSYEYTEYTFEYAKKHSISFVINPRFEFPLTSKFGLNISPIGEFTNENVFLGIGFGVMFGRLQNSTASITQP